MVTTVIRLRNLLFNFFFFKFEQEVFVVQVNCHTLVYTSLSSSFLLRAIRSTRLAFGSILTGWLLCSTTSPSW